MVDPRLETYNYYRDSRVQAAMFSPCWGIVHQEANSAVISFDESWVTECLQIERLEAVVHNWVDEEKDFTATYRELSAKSKEKKLLHAAENKKLEHEYGNFWKAPQDDKDRVNALYQEYCDASRTSQHAFGELYDRAEKKNSVEGLAKEMGFEVFRKRSGEEYKFCMRVRTEFEVCGECRGSGQVVNPSIDCCGLTEEDFYDDPDFHEDYMSGRYDVTCPNCNGKRVEAIPQFPKWLNDAICSYNESQWEGIREQCAELSMGA